MTRAEDTYTLRVPFGVPFPDVWTKDLTVKVILPEYAHDIKTRIQFPVVEVGR